MSFAMAQADQHLRMKTAYRIKIKHKVMGLASEFQELGLEGRMFALARTEHESFGNLLVGALWLKMKAGPEEWTAGNRSMTEEEARAQILERGLPEELLQYIKYDPNNPPAELSKDDQPNGTRELVEATINAAIRHGSDGHGSDGLLGYMLVLERTKFKTFVRLMELAQQWQVKETAQSDKPQPTREEVRALLLARGFDPDIIRKLRKGPYSLDSDEDPDPYGLGYDAADMRRFDPG
jgi:hypothetical protein